MARWGSRFSPISLMLLMGCGSSESRIGRTGPSGGDASAAGGVGGAVGGTGGICIGAAGTGGARTINIFVDRLIIGTGPLCLSRKLEGDGSYCTIVEATQDPTGAGCSRPGRRAPCSYSLEQDSINRLKADNSCGSSNALIPDCSLLGLCEITQADASCLSPTPDPNAVGWCYVDPSQGLGDPSLVASCSAGQQQTLRFVGDNTPSPGAMLLIACGNPPLTP